MKIIFGVILGVFSTMGVLTMTLGRSFERGPSSFKNEVNKKLSLDRFYTIVK